MKRPLVIFGTASLAEVVTFYFTKDSDYEIVAYCRHNVADTNEHFLGKPVIALNQLEQLYPCSNHSVFVAVGYHRMNKTREQICLDLQERGYDLASYCSSKATHWDQNTIGRNVFIFENNTLQPFVNIGDGTIIWSGNHLGHHSTIGSYCFITSHAVISGHCIVGNRCFIGVNATIADSLTIADDCLIGAGALITRNTKPGQVYPGQSSKSIERSSEKFFI